MLLSYFIKNNYIECLEPNYEANNILPTPNINTYDISYAHLLNQNFNDNNQYNDSIVTICLVLFFIFGKYVLGIPT